MLLLFVRTDGMRVAQADSGRAAQFHVSVRRPARSRALSFRTRRAELGSLDRTDRFHPFGGTACAPLFCGSRFSASSIARACCLMVPGPAWLLLFLNRRVAAILGGGSVMRLRPLFSRTLREFYDRMGGRLGRILHVPFREIISGYQHSMWIITQILSCSSSGDARQVPGQRRLTQVLTSGTGLVLPHVPTKLGCRKLRARICDIR